MGPTDSYFYCSIIFYIFTFSAAHQRETYDFVIVGGGTAGCVLAARLTESGDHSVLLLEAGGVPHPDLEIPALSTSNYEGHSRIYKSLPQEHAGLSTNGAVFALNGRALGGTSTVNAMIWNRGNPHNWDTWAEVTGDPSWRYSNMLKYFKKVENYAGDFPSDQHGNGGPITVSRPKYSPGLEEWIEAGEFLGYPVADPNGPQQVSYTPLEFSKLRGRRQSSYTQYLRPALSRPNLRVITSAEATKVMFEGKTATEVNYRVNGTDDRVAVARKEVVISAGTFETPALLLRSGIGPKDVLQNAGVPQIHELSVGANLQDHALVALPFILNNKSAIFDPNVDLNPETLKTFNETGNGPYSTYLGLFGQAFLKSSSFQKSPDIQIYWVGSPTGVPKEFTRRAEDTGSNLDNAGGGGVGVCFATLALPASRGTVVLDPENPDSLPLVDFKYFSNPKDMEVMITGIKAALATFEDSPSFQKLGATFHPGSTKACDEIQFRSDDYWKCFIRQMATYGAHGVGTCRMGKGPEDKDAVIDSSLRIIGLHNIRVVDASVMPTITNANVQAPVYAIAEKAAELMLESYKQNDFLLRQDL